MSRLSLIFAIVVGLAAGQNCSVAVYDDPSSPCYVCDAAINCNPVGGTCVPNVGCSCNYGFGDNNCSAPVVNTDSSAFIFLVDVLGISAEVILSVYAMTLHVYMWYVLGSCAREDVFRSRNLPLLTTMLCFLATTLRIFYYAPDPYAFGGGRVICGSWSIDYFSTCLVAMAFACMTWQWANVVLKLVKTKSAKFVGLIRFLWLLKGFLFIKCIILLLCATASTVLSCVCNDVACPYRSADYLYFISWQVLVGLSIISCVVCAIFVVHGLNNFKERHAKRIRQFTVFIVTISLSMVLLLGYTIALFADYATSSSSFLATETLEIAFIIIIILSILVVLTVTRRGRNDHSQSIGSAGSSSKRGASKGGNSSRKGEDLYAPSQDVSVLDDTGGTDQEKSVNSGSAARDGGRKAAATEVEEDDDQEKDSMIEKPARNTPEDEENGGHRDIATQMEQGVILL